MDSFDFTSQEPLPTGDGTSRPSNSSPVAPRELRPANTGSLSPEEHPQHSGPTVDAHGRTLNPRSCVICRKRKVKCDKIHPCSNCTRAHVECVFPGPGRAPRRVKKHTEGRDAELLARLRRLEGVVKGLGADVEADGLVAAVAAADKDATLSTSRSGSVSEQTGSNPAVRTPSSDKRRREADEAQSGRLENRFGRLVINEGRSRYINNSFWANLSNEVEDLKGILHEETDDEAELNGSSSGPGHHMQGWIFGFSSHTVDMVPLHPSPRLIEAYWRTYKERVDPLAKVLHVPTVEPTVLTAASHLGNLSKSFEALIFAIYYGATTSLSPADCLENFGEERSILLERYRFAVEQALARANFLVTEEMVVLQAFVIFLVCLRRNSDARVIWTLTGLSIRIAQTIGIHRDGAHFGLSPFVIEMRRRMWWQVCILDTRASEDHGCDPSIIENSFDTKMPLNINDVDISPSSKELPVERQGCTDMSFCLIRFEVVNTFRRLFYQAPGKGLDESTTAATVAEKEKWIDECHDKMERKYLAGSDMTIPMYWVTATVARLMVSKMWLMVYHPFQRQKSSLSTEIKDKLFITSMENIEYSILLETEARSMKWGWLFKTYMQWHALAFILSELCHRTSGPLVDRAWVAVDKTCDGRWKDVASTNNDDRGGHLWKPLMRLMTKAKAARARALESESETRSTSWTTATESPRHNSILSTAEMLDAMKKQPRMVQAPLSQAQLSRYMSSGPTFGQRPLEETANVSTKGSCRSRVHSRTGSQPQAGLNQHTGAEQPASHAFGSTNWTMPSTSTGSDKVGALSSGLGSQNTFPPTVFDASATTVGGEDPFAQTTTASDSNLFPDGDMDWASFDELVRQYGMDVDQPSGLPAQEAPSWGAQGWSNGAGNNGTNLGAGMASDWF